MAMRVGVVSAAAAAASSLTPFAISSPVTRFKAPTLYTTTTTTTTTVKCSAQNHLQFMVEAPLAFGAAAVISWCMLHGDSTLAETASRAETLFEQTCAGCHSGGGNVLQPGATLALKDLERNGLDSIDDIYNITYYGKGRMPGYGEKCAPRGQCTFGARISEEDIHALAEFVKLQADRGWLSKK